MEKGALLAELRGVSHGYGKKQALQAVDFSLRTGECVGLLGESGSGKTTLLKILAGKIRPKKGDALSFLKGREARIARQYGCLFPDGELIDWLKIGVQFSWLLRFHGIWGEEAKNRIWNALQITEMQSCEEEFSNHLSRGEYQRVLLARSLLLQPRLLIWDDPLCHVEEGQRKRIWQRVQEWQKKTGAAIIFSAGHKEETIENSSRILLLRKGEMLQPGSLRQGRLHPESHYAAAFLGGKNLLPGEITGFGKKNAVLEMEGIALPCRDEKGIALRDQMILCIDWADMHFGMKPQEKIFLSGMLRGVFSEPGGEMALIELPGGRMLRAYCRRGEDCPIGSRVYVWWDIEKAFLVHRDDSVNI